MSIKASGSHSEGGAVSSSGEERYFFKRTEKGQSVIDESKCCFCGSKKTIFIIMAVGGGTLAILAGIALVGALLPNATSLAAINNFVVHTATVLGSTPVAFTAFAFTVTGTIAGVGIIGYIIQSFVENRAARLLIRDEASS